jgi:D-beta-D-heptose 7-phosphate kinase/D-beta-D-heptose 1-phosphate adenosyltransferase
MHHLTYQRATEILQRFGDCRILVVGDLMLDRYIHGTVDRISPEAPVPVVKVTHERSVPGGACNVGLNIQSLGGQSRVCGLIGTCAQGDELLDHLRHAGVDVSAVRRDPEVSTIVKTRIVSDRQQMLRVDREQAGMREAVRKPEFQQQLLAGLRGISAAVLEDYGKGVIEQEVVRPVLDHCRPRQIPTGLDPKDNHELDVRGIGVATPNRKEAFAVAGIRDREQAGNPLMDGPLLQAADRLSDLWQTEHLMITLGPQGMLLKEKSGEVRHVSTRAREVFDVSGAGDTVIATTMLALAAGATFFEAADLANVAAGIVVAKLGTATVTPAEILAELEEE